ncbi:aminotransferase-like domain-containing protein [Litorisediminicola beolgyonensis]|uniref:PLP-dependent aminotransferase family protein n=1 Tax=Litorisediminicola beolgyonensis TaxID=1173614 RepID=A0ABW3ZK72_9RHOB
MDTISERFAAAPGPKYRALATALKEAIAAGELTPGDRLPPVRELAWTLSITPGTAARAYTILTDAGRLTAEVGRGTFVAATTRQPPGRPALLPEPRWPQRAVSEETEQVSLFSPKLPDMGQSDLIRDAFARLASSPPERLLNYPSRPAFTPAREAVLGWLRGTPLGPVDQQDLVLSHGGQNGISLVMQAVLRGPKPVVLVEELSYPGFRRAAELLRAEVVSVPMDARGIDPEALDRIAAQSSAQLLCTSPEVHNPTGIFTALERREAIAEIARRRGFHIMEDDCYRTGRSHERSYRALLPEQGWYVSSISKLLTPALRIGFVVAPKPWTSELRRVAEYGFFGIAQPLADLVADILPRAETLEIAERVRLRVADYVRAAVNALGRHDLIWREDMPYLWLRLPDGWRAGAFVQAAEAVGVQLRAADEFALRDGRAPHAVRMGINAQVALESFEAAMGRLRDLLDNPPDRIAV